MSALAAQGRPAAYGNDPRRRRRRLMGVGGALVALVFLAPYLVMVLDSLRSSTDVKTTPPSILPQRSSNKIIVAESGNLSILKPSNQVWLNLKNAETHLWDPKKPDRYDLNTNLVQRMRLPD